MVPVVITASLFASLVQVNQAAGGEGSGSATWAVVVAILAAVAAIASAILSARAASQAREHSERSLEHSQEAQALLLKLERRELESRRTPPSEERPAAAAPKPDPEPEPELDRFEASLKRFLECMAKHDGKGTVATSLDCGLATLFENDEEIRRVDEAFRRSHERSPSVFGNLAREFDDRDAKQILDQWVAMSQKEKFAVGGLTVWIKAQPRKPR